MYYYYTITIFMQATCTSEIQNHLKSVKYAICKEVDREQTLFKNALLTYQNRLKNKKDC